jgi:hypothetical protein
MPSREIEELSMRRRWRDIPRWTSLVALTAGVTAFSCLLMAGCAVSTQVTTTARSSIEQQLLVRSLERAVAQLDVERFIDKRVYLTLFSLTPDQMFAKAFVSAQLEQRGLYIVSDWDQADLLFKVFAPVFGTDQGQTLVGIPSLVVPLVGAAVPEVSLYKAVRNRGQSEVQVYAFDSRTGEFVDKLPVSNGQAKYDQYTILVLISFNWSDLDERLDWREWWQRRPPWFLTE